MRATKKLLGKNTALQNHNVALRFEVQALRNLLDDAYGLLIDHHSSWRMVQSVCEVCSDPIKRMTVHRLERIRQELNTERVMAITQGNDGFSSQNRRHFNLRFHSILTK